MGKSRYPAKHTTVTSKCIGIAETDSPLHADLKCVSRGTRSKSPGASQIHPLHGPKANISCDRGSSDSSGDQPKASPIKLAGILRSGITSIYKEHARSLWWEFDSDPTVEVASFDPNFLDHEVGQEFIKQRSLELAQSHARSQDSRSASRRQQAPLAKDVSTQTDPIKDSDSQLPTNNGQNVTFVDSTLRPPPPGPCAQCSQSGHGKTLRRFSPEKLAAVTDGYSADNNFGYQHEKLFKGILDGQRVYVVRRDPHEKEKVFSEVDMLRSIEHPNIVNLIGYCDEEDNLALVFAFVCNRCLSFHLDVKNLKCSMQWPHRANLAVQLSKGLVYLHDNSIIHGNVNSSYVFVHRDFTPLIAQFSLARRIADGREVIDEDRSGDKKSRGYLAPEYKPGGKLSMPQDVYAFGVILFELITGRPAVYRFDKKEIFLGEWGRLTFEEFQASENLPRIMLDRRLDATKFNKSDVLRMIKVASRCTQTDPDARPLMREVLEMLRSDVEQQPPKCIHSDVVSSDVVRSDIPKGEDLQAGTRSQVEENENVDEDTKSEGDTESEESQTSEDPETGDVHLTVDPTVDPYTDAMETGRTPMTSDENEDLTITKMAAGMAGKLLRDLKGSASELNRFIHKVPLMPNAQETRFHAEFYPFNYYQKRTTARKSQTPVVSKQPPTVLPKSSSRRPGTPGHHLHVKNKPVFNLNGERADSKSKSPSTTGRFSSVLSEETPMSPVRVNVIIRDYNRMSTGATSAKKIGKRVKFSNQRSWPMSVLLPDHHHQ